MLPASPTTTFRTGTSAGCVAGTIATLANVPPDAASAVLQLRVWQTKYGSWDGAVAAWYDNNNPETRQLGASPFFVVNNLGGGLNNPPQMTCVSFNLVARVPEPSSWVLASLGLVCVSVRRRCRK